MNRRKHDISLHLVKALNVAIVVACFAGVWYGYYGNIIVSPYFNKGNWAVILLYALLYFFLGRTYDSFLISGIGPEPLAV